MADLPIPARPPTPQVLLHRLPEKPESTTRKPSKYIILITGSTTVAGKVQIARSVANALSSPFFQGESLHDSSAKAAEVGSSRPAAARESVVAGTGGVQEQLNVQAAATTTSGPNKARYQRMWLSKMTRTGRLFPEESRPATEGFSGFGGTSSTSTSRRGSASSIASTFSNTGMASTAPSSRSESMSSPHPTHQVTNISMLDASSGPNAVFRLSDKEQLRRSNPALMVLTHPELESWHKLAIRSAVGDYGIGVIFVPLDAEDEEWDEEDLPVLRPLDPTTMTSFPVSFSSFAKKQKGWGNLDEEMKLQIDLNADIDGQTAEIIDGVRDVMGVDEGEEYDQRHITF